MQRSDDSPAGGTRPSLLSPAQHVQADRHGILSSLEGSAPIAGKAAPRPGRRLWWWSAGGVAGLLVTAAALWFWVGNGAPVPVAVPVPVAAASAPADAAPLASAPAAIHEEPPTGPAGGEPERLGQAGSAPDGKDTLGGMLQAPQPAAEASAAVLTQALETPPVLAKAPKPAAKEKSHAKPAPAKPVVEPDSDVTLLTALIAHLQGTPARKKTPSDVRAELKECRQLAADPAGKCVARVCAGAGKNDGECAAPEKAPAPL